MDERFGEVSPLIMLPEVSSQLSHIIELLRLPQPIAHRRRLCSSVGRLAGLRAWLLFDLAAHEAADAWFGIAIDAANEAEDANLRGWLFGARSLITHDRDDHRSALNFIEQGLSSNFTHVSDESVATWLYALQARSYAALGDQGNFSRAWRRANTRLDRTSVAGRRHGMDFVDGRLDLTYYEGASRMHLNHDTRARNALQRSLSLLPSSRPKARAVSQLTLAAVVAKGCDFDEAGQLARDALDTAHQQPIMPILWRARDVRARLPKSQARVDLDHAIDAFETRLSTSRQGQPW